MTSLSYYDTTVLALGALFLGISMLIRGGNWAVDAAVFIAYQHKISPMVVGFTIIAFGTSLPELIVSVFANIQGSPGIALGNVIGSNIANILLVLGFAAIFVPLKAKADKGLTRDVLFMLFATLSLTILLNYGAISRIAGLTMIAILGAYIFVQYKTTNSEEFEDEDFDEASFKNNFFAYATLLIGLACIAVGAEFLVRGARVSAGLVGVPESVIALSIVAFGTSLPELSTSIIAARKNQSDMVIGNIIGSNVFNIFMILGAASLIKPITQGSFSDQLANFDIWVTLAVALLFSAVVFLMGKINRITGSLFFLTYIAYNIYIYANNMGG